MNGRAVVAVLIVSGIVLATALVAAVIVLVTAPKAAAQRTTYACVIASMNKQIYYKGGFLSWVDCMAWCAYNANIRSLGGQLEIRYNCPPERW